MGSDNITDIVEWAESQGWTVRLDKNGYRRFFDPDDSYIVRYPAIHTVVAWMCSQR